MAKKFISLVLLHVPLLLVSGLGQNSTEQHASSDDMDFLQSKVQTMMLTELATSDGKEEATAMVNNTVKEKATTMENIPDSERFAAWSEYTQYSGKVRPRVLLYTWCSNNSYFRYPNEMYWKMCYARLHGFDVLFSDESTEIDVKKQEKANLDDVEKVYSDFFMWAWVFGARKTLRKILLSGEYDYVWMTGADVLIHEPNIYFPVWALDSGHDLTVMDQNFHSFGLNENALLFRASNWSVQFLDDMLEHRFDFNIQGDNGPYMEAILTGLGREADADGKPGYDNKCRKLLKLEHSAAYLFNTDPDLYTRINDGYANCFFAELERMVGPYGNRTSKRIGFAPTSGPDMLPWANCWSVVRDYWKNWSKNCLSLHWNGYKGKSFYHPQAGQCPDPSLDWRASIYNPDNRDEEIESAF